jgi:hypothetical protein
MPARFPVLPWRRKMSASCAAGAELVARLPFFQGTAMDDEKPIVLILCTGNSARSQMAEAFLRKYQGERYDVRSAGTDPKPQVHPLAVAAMKEGAFDYLLKDRLTRLGEFVELTGFFFGPVPEYPADLLVPKKGTLSDSVDALEQVKGLLESLPQPWTHEEWEGGMRAIADSLGLKAGDLFMILRVAVTGSKVSPPLFESMEILGRDEILSRVNHALDLARTTGRADKAESTLN